MKKPEYTSDNKLPAAAALLQRVIKLLALSATLALPASSCEMREHTTSTTEVNSTTREISNRISENEPEQEGEYGQNIRDWERLREQLTNCPRSFSANGYTIDILRDAPEMEIKITNGDGQSFNLASSVRGRSHEIKGLYVRGESQSMYLVTLANGEIKGDKTVLQRLIAIALDVVKTRECNDINKF